MEAGRHGRFYGDDRDFTPDYSKNLVPSVAVVEVCLWLYGFQSRDEIGFLVVQKVQDLPDGVYCPFEDDFLCSSPRCPWEYFRQHGFLA